MVFIQDIIYLKKDRAYIINLDEYKSLGTQWIALYVNGNNVTYFDSLIMCRYVYIGFIDFMLNGKKMLDYINSCFPNE